VGLLDGKRLLVTGVLTKDSLAFAVAELAQKEGAEIVLTRAGGCRSPPAPPASCPSPPTCSSST
jgi:enoyl-[acyl-carrier protein] reductase I